MIRLLLDVPCLTALFFDYLCELIPVQVEITHRHSHRDFEICVPVPPDECDSLEEILTPLCNAFSKRHDKKRGDEALLVYPTSTAWLSRKSSSSPWFGLLTAL